MNPVPFRLDGQVALVTGGARGIGAAIVTRLAEAGARVVIANRTLDVAEALAGRLTSEGLSVRAVPLQGLSRSALAALVDDVLQGEGRLDIAVHNAGGCPWAEIHEMTEDDLDEALGINLKAAVWLTQAAMAVMQPAGYGRILFTSSVSARVAMAGGAHYSAAKAGLNAFVRGAGFEMARSGITVNAVEPGFIAKPGRGTLSTPEKQLEIGAAIPMGRMGEADDIACAMLYLASREAKYMTGQTIVVDGGSTLPETGYAVTSHFGAQGGAL